MLIRLFLLGCQAETPDQRLVLGKGFDRAFCMLLAAAVPEALVGLLDQLEVLGVLRPTRLPGEPGTPHPIVSPDSDSLESG